MDSESLKAISNYKKDQHLEKNISPPLSKIDKIKSKFGIVLSIFNAFLILSIIYIIGEIVDIFISFALNRSMKNITKIDNDNILSELINETMSTKSKSNSTSSFEKKYPNYDMNEIKNNINNSQFSKFKFGNNYEFKTVNTISDEFDKYFMYFTILAIVSIVFSFFIYYLYSNISLNQGNKLRSMVFQGYISEGLDFHKDNNNKPSKLVSNILNSSILIENTTGPVSAFSIQNKITRYISIIVALFVGFKLVLYIFLLFLLVILFLVLFSYLNIRFREKKTKYYNNYGPNAIIANTLSSIKAIIPFGCEQDLFNAFMNKLNNTKKYDKKEGIFSNIHVSLVSSAQYIFYFIIFMISGKFVYDGKCRAGDVFKIIFYILTFQNSKLYCNLYIFNLSKALIVSQNVVKYIKHHCLNTFTHNHLIISYKDELNEDGYFKSVIKCLPGHTTAIVTDSNSKKSNINRLLESLINAEKSTYVIDDIKIRKDNKSPLLSHIGYVSDDDVLFSVTIAENIAIAIPDVSQEKIEIVAKMVDAHEFITMLPQGYQTVIDDSGANGVTLNPEQKQRLCIARALINNPKMIILNDATSALDSHSENIIFERLKSISSEKHLIIVTQHFIPLIKEANSILVMDQDFIAESGTHDELMRKHEIYYHRLKYCQENTNTINENENIYVSDDISHKELVAKPNVKQSDIKNAFSMGSMDHPLNEKDTPYIPWKRIISFNKPVMLYFVLFLVGSIINSIILPYRAVLFGKIMDTYSKHGKALSDTNKKYCIQLIYFSLCIFVIRFFVYGNHIIIKNKLTFITREKLFKTMIQQDLSFFDLSDAKYISEENIYDGKHNKVEEDFDIINKDSSLSNKFRDNNLNLGYTYSYINVMIVEIIGFITSCIIAYLYHNKMCLILLIFVPFLFIGLYCHMKIYNSNNSERRKIHAESSRIALNAFSNIKAISELGLVKYASELYENELNKHLKSMKIRNFIYSIFSTIFDYLGIMIFLVGFYFGFQLLKEDKIDLLHLFVVIFVMVFSSAITILSIDAFTTFTDSIISFNGIFSVLDCKPKIDSSNPNGIRDVPLNGKITLDGIKFSYPTNSSSLVIDMEEEVEGEGNNNGDGMKIEIPGGKKIAIVGHKKSGKTTLLKLLLRLYDVNQGAILIDDIKNTDYNVKWLRQKISMVEKEPIFFDSTIRKIICCGLERDVSDEELEKVCKMVGIHDKIKGWCGYDYNFKSCVSNVNLKYLSQGISLARTLIRDPKIILLDEINAGLDAESETNIQKLIDEVVVQNGRTTIIVPHRLSSIQDADLILVMKNGNIVEKGRHDELMELNGEYCKLISEENNENENENQS